VSRARLDGPDGKTTEWKSQALEAKMAQEGFVLTESQVIALEKAKTEKGEFESECPGYCVFLRRRPSCLRREGCEDIGVSGR
jgi:hypothetical protein